MSSNAAASLPGQTRRPDNLALAFQEILTVIERLRSNRQPIPDAATFRQQFRAALQQADAEARRRGYTAEDIQLAIFAVVAFLDESILNLRSPVFADWPRQPLQEEFFGHHIAGEVFFQHLQRLIGANESHATADVLEVFYLCLLLGFAGRYSIGGRGELRSLMDQAADKIRRIRKHASRSLPPLAYPARGGGRGRHRSDGQAIPDRGGVLPGARPGAVCDL
jgi:type VI secretion system protein ImpK